VSLMDEKDDLLLERGAANDIVRLRWRLQTRENIIGRLVAENERLRKSAPCPHVCGAVTQHCSLNFTLTDEERAAIELLVEYSSLRAKDEMVFRSLLKRARDQSE